MQPTIGRIVHYQRERQAKTTQQPEPLPAIVVEVGLDEACTLTVFHPAGQFSDLVPHAPNDEPTPGHWNWPPRIS